MDKHIRDFLKYILLEKRYSKHTSESYTNDLRQFQDFLQKYQNSDSIFWQRVDRKVIRYFLAYLQEQNYSRRTIARKLATVKSFFKYLVREEILKKNPALSVKMPRYEKKLPEYISLTEMDRLFKTSKSGTFEELRNLAMLELFYGSGIRLSELINLKTVDIFFEENLIRVIGKGNKERIIPFGENAKQILIKYLEIRPQYANKNVDNVFVLKNGNQMYPMAVQRIVKKYLSDISDIHIKSPHVLRHTYATHLLNAGAGIRVVKDLLGHENLSTTQIYTHLSVDHLKSVYNQAHPGATKKTKPKIRRSK